MNTRLNISFLLSAILLLVACSTGRHTFRKGEITIIKGKYKVHDTVAIPADSALGQAIVYGQVLDKRTDAPVYLSFVEPKQRDENAITDRQGYYKLKIPEGNYSIVARAMNHDSITTRQIYLKKNTRTEITFYLGQQVFH